MSTFDLEHCKVWPLWHILPPSVSLKQHLFGIITMVPKKPRGRPPDRSNSKSTLYNQSKVLSLDEAIHALFIESMVDTETPNALGKNLQDSKAMYIDALAQAKAIREKPDHNEEIIRFISDALNAIAGNILKQETELEAITKTLSEQKAELGALSEEFSEQEADDATTDTVNTNTRYTEDLLFVIPEEPDKKEGIVDNIGDTKNTEETEVIADDINDTKNTEDIEIQGLENREDYTIADAIADTGHTAGNDNTNTGIPEELDKKEVIVDKIGNTKNTNETEVIVDNIDNTKNTKDIEIQG